MMTTIAVSTTRLAVVLAATLLPLAGCAVAQTGPGGFAQRLLEEVVKQHPELKGMELSASRGDGCVTIAASDASDIGDKCDEKERHALRSGEPDIEDPSATDPFYIITEALHDASGKVVGLIVMDILPQPGADRAATLTRARAIRREVEARIPSGAHLTGSTSADASAPTADTSYAPRIDPRSFAAAVTNPYFPLVPGTTLRFRGTGDASDETTVVTVTSDTREIMGIRATVVHDQVFNRFGLIEDTYDWYAQDGEGNVWYLGEDTKEYGNGKVITTKGSWEAGVGGAKPGIVMWANPAAHLGKAYRQEYLPGEAEDMGKILSVNEAVAVPYGHFKDCIKTEDTTPLEPTVREHKYYCRGVGVVKEVESASEASELVTVQKAKSRG